METTTDFGAWLRQARAAHDLTQEALAEAVGCSTQTIRSFEVGRRRPSRPMAERIGEVLGLPAAERERLVRLARAPLAPPTPARPEPGPPRRPLPAPPSLIGRQDELARLRATLLGDGRRLVTLLGPGGIGKTCLALQAAADVGGQFADGAAFVALAPLTDPAGLPAAIAEALGCPLVGARPPEAALGDFLRDRELLLILDNAEQLLGPAHADQGPALFSALLDAAPELRLLVTSRERLGLRDEWVIALGGLTLPDDRAGAPVERSAAALLFLERARQVEPGFALTAQNRQDVARICRLLGGVPLAIELAAAWVRVLSCAEIAAQVAQDAGALSAVNRDTPARHRSLRAVLDHSWQLLAPAERRLLARLAIFPGGCRREELAAVLGAPTPAALLTPLAALVDRSLVNRLQAADGTTRYDLHEFVRQYAAARLAEEPGAAAEAGARHAATYAAWLAAQEPGLKSARQRATAEAISAEAANLRAAWQWACAQRDAAMLRQMLPALDWFYELRGWYGEAAAAFDAAAQALQAAAAPGAPEQALTCYWLAHGRVGFHRLRRDPGFAVRRLAESVEALRRVSRDGEQIHCLKGLAYVNLFAGNYAAAEAMLEEARAIAVARGDGWNLAMTLVIRGVMEALRSPAPAARRYLTEALETARAVGDPRPVAMGLTYLGLTAMAQGEPGEAERLVREAHLLAAEHQDRFQVALALQALGRVAAARGDEAEAGWLFGESLAVARELGDNWLEAQALGCRAGLAAAAGDLDAARAGRRAALAKAAAAPQPIALDELGELAALELDERPDAALAALAYLRRHPLARAAARAAAERRWAEAAARLPAEQLAAAEAAGAALPLERPAALLDLLGPR